jgi:predicted phage baseplate assembly protein
MALTLPPADNRTFASLMTDVRARLPRLAPDWTDHNAHDPGITLLELFAHLTEVDLYRLGRVTVAQRRSFLRWFGLEPGGPTVAETVVALSTAAATGPGPGPVRVEADREIAAGSGDVVFSTTAAVTVQPARIAGLFAGERRIFATTSAGPAAVLDASTAALGPRVEDALVIEFDRPVTGDVSLYIWTGAADHDEDVRRRLTEEAAAVLRDRPKGGGACPPSRAGDWRRHHDVDLVWEMRTASGWVIVSEVEDSTRALTLSGFVRLGVNDIRAVAAAPETSALRVRAVRGRYEAPPVVKAVLLNAAPTRHQSRSFSTRLGSSNGRAGQVFRVARSSLVPAPGAPLVFDRTAVNVVPAGHATAWTVATDWDRAGTAASIVVLDTEAAEVRFGDGHTGSVPPAGAFIDLVSRVGGGAGGNVPARTLSRVSRGPGLGAEALEVLQPFAARGGGPAPAVADLQARLLVDLARPTRAATLADFERLARETPGVLVGRVRAMSNHHPGFRGLPALGCVTVVVVPQGPGSRLVPTTGLLAAVGAYLGRRRPVTTELHVVGPTYIDLAVRARLHLFPQAVATTVQAEAARRLDEFFHPLTGGEERDGWPVGRDICRAEVLTELQKLSGVHHIDELSLLVGPTRAPLCENVTVCPTDLVAAMPHEITIAAARIQ